MSSVIHSFPRLSYAYTMYAMRVIKPARIREYAKLHPRAKASLEAWLMSALAASWRSLGDVPKTWRSADQVKVAIGRVVLVFNIAGNAFRLIVAAHFNRQLVFVLMS
jgi:mRNA interferase HigB